MNDLIKQLQSSGPSWLAGRGHWPGVPGRPRPHRQKFQRSYKCGGGDASCTFPHFCGQLLVESMQSLNLVFCPFLWSAVGRVYAVPRILEQPLSFIAYLGNELRNDWSSRVYLTPDWLRGDGLAPIQNIRTSGAMCHLRSSELSRPVRGCTYRSVAISRLCSFSSLIIGNSFSCPCFCPKLPLIVKNCPKFQIMA